MVLKTQTPAGALGGRIAIVDLRKDRAIKYLFGRYHNNMIYYEKEAPFIVSVFPNVAF